MSFGVGNVPPTEFRIFVAGWNPTEKGNFLFDEQAATAVMSAYQRWGIDVAIDLEHQMLSPEAGADPTARDARGWCNLEVRPDGSLWAVNVRWTTDGAERLTEKRQRYISPAFDTDETGRITQMINIAITALPATHHTPALVAASLRGLMDPTQVKAALDALIAGDAEKCSEILQNMIAAAASGETAPESQPQPGMTEDAARPPPAPGAAPAASDDEAPPSSGAPVSSEDPTKKKSMQAASARLMRLSGRATVSEALDDVEIWRKSHLALETERAKVAAESAALESTERLSLVAQLVKLGAETPATAWASAETAGKKACDRLAGEPIAGLRTRVKALAAAKGNPRMPKPAPEAGDGSKTFSTPNGAITLSASELKNCAELGAKPEVYAANKAAREALRAGGNAK